MAFRFTNNVLSTAQQVWLRKLGGAKPAVSENASGIITAGRAKRAASQPVQPGERSVLHDRMRISIISFLKNLPSDKNGNQQV